MLPIQRSALAYAADALIDVILTFEGVIIVI
jgi:hypothetical protein